MPAARLRRKLVRADRIPDVLECDQPKPNAFKVQARDQILSAGCELWSASVLSASARAWCHSSAEMLV